MFLDREVFEWFLSFELFYGSVIGRRIELVVVSCREWGELNIYDVFLFVCLYV